MLCSRVAAAGLGGRGGEGVWSSKFPNVGDGWDESEGGRGGNFLLDAWTYSTSTLYNHIHCKKCHKTIKQQHTKTTKHIKKYIKIGF